MTRWSAVVGGAVVVLALSGSTVLPYLAPPEAPRETPTPLPTTVDPAIPNNTACLAYWAVKEHWYENGTVEQYALDLRAILPDADEFMAGQLTNFADALDGIEKDIPLGQVEAISESQLSRVCAEAGVPEPVPDIVVTY
ncbi:hypothetical protein MT349_16165 [Rathayibacter caricis]|uniref:hypothetical protein n=1 Tax=Rathayibacter caricis TaxID=110936 RepID=UPI001FB3BDE3|nr:hypothetical protein [Rathayibacter caricis]MCJ1697320.1 hypothetical protein [Rathayibacter caricis]